MGVIYFGLCWDCKEYIDLDKFYSWSVYAEDACEYEDIDKDDLSIYANEGFVYRSLRLHSFMVRHNGHRLGVYTDEQTYEQRYEQEGWKEVYPWPTEDSVKPS